MLAVASVRQAYAWTHAWISGFSERHKILLSTETKKQSQKLDNWTFKRGEMKETHKFEFTEFRRPSKLATSLNLEDFWGMFRLSFKSNSGSETVRIRFAIVIKRHKPSSQLTLFKPKHNHMLVAFSRVSSSFLVFLCVLWVTLVSSFDSLLRKLRAV